MLVNTPRYSLQEIWNKIPSLYKEGTIIHSLTGRKYHHIIWIDETTQQYKIKYESGNTKKISIEDLYVLYSELYKIGSLTNSYMQQHCERLLDWSKWHAPGSAMFALLPFLDDNIQVQKGELHIKTMG